MDSRHPATRRQRRRPGDAGLDSLARRGGSRTQGGRLRHHEAPACRILAAGAHAAAGDAGVAVVVHPRRALHVLDRPEPPAGDQAALARLFPRGAPRSGARAVRVPGGYRRLLQAKFPSVPVGRGWTRGRLLGQIACRARVSLTGELMTTQAATTTVIASDGVPLAVHVHIEIDKRRPTILAIHGYPDNHHVWDGVAANLADRYNFVAYDVRGAGQSARPAGRSGYLMRQLVSDVGTVIDGLGVGQVHLMAHDWGSIQAWAAVTDDAVMGKIASFTSISGPHLNYAGRFLRSPRTPRAVFDVVRQILASGYIWFFLCPGVPGLAIRARATVKVFEAVELIGRSGARGQRRAATVRSIDDYLNGLNLYRANMPGPILAPPAELPKTSVPVRVLVARKD